MSDESSWQKDIGDGLSVTFKKNTVNDNYIIIELVGRIDSYNARNFTKSILPELNAANNIIFDFSEVNYISSTGIGAFITFYKMVRKNGGNIVFLNVKPRVWEIFQLLGFDQFFLVKQNLNEAINFLTTSA